MTTRPTDRPRRIVGNPAHGFRSIEDVKYINECNGYHWFSPDTLRFFRSRVGSTLYGGRFFTTSEQGPDNVRRYSVRRANDDGSIDTVGAFQQYATAAEARKAAQAAARGED